MKGNELIRRAVKSALFAGALSSVVPAIAADNVVQEVVVTGSRIAQPNLETTSPVTQVTSADIAAQGVTRVEDLINQLPQAFAAQNATVANGSTGTATINLRGLGSARTLVLVDGRRMPYGGVTNSAADINQIPAAMVDRVEILTGGASATYGSDAIAGVVNFIMKKDFEGVQVDGQYSLYSHNNSYGGPGSPQLRDVIAAKSAANPSQYQLPDSTVTDGNGIQGSFLIGANSKDGRGNFTAYITYSDNREILEANRDYSACTLGATSATAKAFTCGGSGTSYPGEFTDFSTFNYTINSAGAGNTFRNYSSATDAYNFGPLNHYLRPDARYSVGATGHYDFNDNADVYTQLMYTDDRSIAQIAPGGIFFGTYDIHCDNPLLSANQKTGLACSAADIAASNTKVVYIGRRNVEGGGRQQDFHNSSIRMLAGIKGNVAAGWDYDVSWQFSRTNTDQITDNFFVGERITRALDVVNGPNGPTCRSVIDGSDKNCVPYNLWQIGGVTPAALAYIQAPGVQAGVIDQTIISGQMTGDLGDIGGKFPWANNPIKVAFGVENRHDKITNVTDALLTTGDLSGTGGPTIGIDGATQVTDYFAEANIPIAEGKTGAEKLSMDLGYRYSNYTTDVTTNTYKIGADWAPVEDVRFRASYQRAIRAANIVELFTANGFNLFDMPGGDPCAAAGLSAAVTARCVATGVPAGNVGNANVLNSPAGQYNFLQGGNPHLQPEESTTKSMGVVFTPSFLHGFSLSIDYFDIRITNLISTYGAANRLTACYQNGDLNSCTFVHRNPLGQLWVGSGFVSDTNVNIGGESTQGYDVNLSYTSLQMGGAGSLSFNVTGTYLKNLITDPGTGVAPYDCAGHYAGLNGDKCFVPKSTWRHQFRTMWSTPLEGLNVALTWRYFSAVTLFEDPVTTRLDHQLDAQSYFDLFVNYAFTDKLSARFGVNNVLDKDPPITSYVGVTGNGNTYPQIYDAFGRFVFAGFTAKF